MCERNLCYAGMLTFSMSDMLPQMFTKSRKKLIQRAMFITAGIYPPKTSPLSVTRWEISCTIRTWPKMQRVFGQVQWLVRNSMRPSLFMNKTILYVYRRRIASGQCQPASLFSNLNSATTKAKQFLLFRCNWYFKACVKGIYVMPKSRLSRRMIICHKY